MTVISSPETEFEKISLQKNVSFIAIPMKREIHPLKDLISLFRLYRVLRILKPDIVNASTPKAGLLGMLASRMAGIPHRIYMIRGLRMETTSGYLRSILFAGERIACACAHRVFCVSQSLLKICRENNLGSTEKFRVLGSGSSNGVDVIRFGLPRDRYNICKGFGIPDDAPVIGFVGRFTRDKGIRELLQSFEMLSEKFPALHLLLIGQFEAGDRVDPDTRAKLKKYPRIVHAGFVDDTAPCYSAMDVLVFPSYREGLPNAPLEAAASGIPTVAFRVTGTVDAVVDESTGILVERGDVQGLVLGITRYLQDESLRKQHGNNGQGWVKRNFSQETVWNSMIDEYHRLLASHQMDKTVHVESC